jgi:hypothetical protein
VLRGMPHTERLSWLFGLFLIAVAIALPLMVMVAKRYVAACTVSAQGPVRTRVDARWCVRSATRCLDSGSLLKRTSGLVDSLRAIASPLALVIGPLCGPAYTVLTPGSGPL